MRCVCGHRLTAGDTTLGTCGNCKLPITAASEVPTEGISLVTRIGLAIENDDDDQSERLTDLYERASTPQKGILDEAFICLCGWSLETLIAGKENG